LNEPYSGTSKKIPGQLNGTLRNLIGKFQNTLPNQSLENLSPLRRKSLTIFGKLDKLSDKYVKHSSLKALIMGFVRPHITKIISTEIPEPELSQVLKECYEELREEFEEITIAKELKLGPADKKLSEKILKLPTFEKYKEISEALF